MQPTTLTHALAGPPHFGSGLRVCGLNKSYGLVKALTEVSFDVAPGEIFGLLGVNGAGKTTTLECILDLRLADAGQIFLNGSALGRKSGQTKNQIGAQLQSAGLQDDLTPRQALRHFASFYENAAKPDELLARFSLTEKAHASFRSLSGGEKQRLFLAIALVNNPEVLILDEPTVGLDPQSRRDLHAQIRAFKASGRTVLFSTHYMEEAEELCDRVGILERGCIIANDTPNALIAQLGASPRLSIQTSVRLDPSTAKSLSSVTAADATAEGWCLRTADLDQTMRSLMDLLQTNGHRLLALRVQPPTLEDAFLALTGRPWAGSEPEEKS